MTTEVKCDPGTMGWEYDLGYHDGWEDAQLSVAAIKNENKRLRRSLAELLKKPSGKVRSR